MQSPSAAGSGSFFRSFTSPLTATVVFCDNVSAVYMTANPVHHRRTKHIKIDIHFVREKVALGQFGSSTSCPLISLQFADIMTKGLPVQLLTDFRSSLCVRLPPAAIAGEYYTRCCRYSRYPDYLFPCIADRLTLYTYCILVLQAILAI
jgi:hypothetical protein